MDRNTLSVAGVCGLAALAGTVAYQLLVQNGRLMLRVEALEHRLDELDEDGSTQPSLRGLPAGTVVQDFDLPTLAGERVRLSAWRGQRVLLIFFSPDCGFCRQMVADLAMLSPAPTDGRPVPLIITTGSVPDNRQLLETAGVRCPILVQDDREVARLYLVDGTPMAYLIDERGSISAPLAVGAESVLALAEARVPLPASSSAPDQHRHLDDLVTRAPVKSRINRSGLTAGTPAPGFRLTRADGGELGLDEFRGQKVLLVFSDPACGPCNQLMPQLERAYRAGLRGEVLVVSRGSAEANRAKVAEYELSFPVALQRHWEISRAYAMFATPIGYLIDEHGVIAADVAEGAEAILALASRLADRDRLGKEALVRASRRLMRREYSRRKGRRENGQRV
jgi:peroxiredoxin